MNHQKFSMGGGIPLTPVVKKLLIINVAIWFVFQVILENFFHLPFTPYFSLIPNRVVFDFWIWQPVTYMFLHGLNVTHILFNMLMLWFMGGELELKWGSKKILRYYLTTGVGGGLIYIVGHLLYALVTGSPGGMGIPVVGASGALFGLMLAWGLLFGERTIYFMMMFAMKAKVFVLILAAIQISSLLTTTLRGSEVAYLAHLGGLLAGFIYLKFPDFWNRLQKQKRNKFIKTKSGLRLVVNNDPQSKESGRPRYWN